jgi:hypothetical protein
MLNFKSLLLVVLVAASFATSANAQTAKYEYSAKPADGKTFRIKSKSNPNLCLAVNFTKINILSRAEYLLAAPCQMIQEYYFRYGDNNMIILARTWQDEYLTLDADYTQYQNNPLARRVKLLKAYNRPEQQIVVKPVKSGGYTLEFGHGGVKYQIGSDIPNNGKTAVAHEAHIKPATAGNANNTWIIDPIN